MTNNPSEEPTKWKIFPRNLTARADHIVRGNPTNTRPESGVENCYPGLEFDQRNLDKAFFPGLVFEFHRDDGAILHHLVPDSVPAQEGLTIDDLDGRRPLYLWALRGRTTVDQSMTRPPIFFFRGLNGLEVWRRVHDLLPGPITILLGPGPGFSADPETESDALEKLVNGEADISRTERGNHIRWAVFTGDRARYLDENGVIDVSVYQPGEITRTLCAPWQYDFRDCGCFYWAANKPDLVTSAGGEQPYLDFQRSAVLRGIHPPPPDVPDDKDGRRTAQELDYADLVQGWWNNLPVVLNDRESERFTPLSAPSVPQLMTRQQVIDELNYLAKVEHALCVEYLYAHYSLNAPLRLPEIGVDDLTRRAFAAAYEVFSVAVDEMRHLRWVNEALQLLGQPPSLGRADSIGRQFDRPFELQPLTPAQLDWFIEVEEPSQSLDESDEGVDGMYVRLHTSILRQPDPQVFPERDRLVHLIKLIIDEGQDHYERFKSVKTHLSPLLPAAYLRTLENAPPGSELEKMQDHSDVNYEVLLGALSLTFSLGDRAGGVLLEQSRRAMFNLHETNHYLASRGVRPRFTLPSVPVPPVTEPTVTAAAAHAFVDSLASSAQEDFLELMDAGAETEQTLGERQQRVNEELFAQMHHLIREDLGS